MVVKGGRDSGLFRPLVITADTLTRSIHEYWHLLSAISFFFRLIEHNISTAKFKAVINLAKNRKAMHRLQIPINFSLIFPLLAANRDS